MDALKVEVLTNEPRQEPCIGHHGQGIRASIVSFQQEAGKDIKLE